MTVKNDYLEFQKHFVNTLNKHSSKKAKAFRGNHKPHTTKTHRKTIIKRLKLEKKAIKTTRDPKDFIKYKKQYIPLW